MKARKPRKTAGVMRTLPLLFAGVVAVLVVGSAFAEGPAGTQVRPGTMVQVLAADYDANTYLRPRSDHARKAATAVFDVEYEGFTPEAEAAFQYAVNIWSSLISSPVVIKVKATWEELGPGVLGSAGSPFVYQSFENAPKPLTWYHSALADALAGEDVGIGPDITASFSSVFENWYLGTDGDTPPGQFDLVTVVMHELGHGLGFSGSGTVTPFTGTGAWGMDGYPMIYDDFVEDLAGGEITDTDVFPNPSTELADVFTSNQLYWGGGRAVSVNDDERPLLYAPFVFNQGSSYSHLDEDEYPPGDPNVLMTPFIGTAEAIHDPGPITLCMFQDIGWTTAQDCGDGAGVESYSFWIATASQAGGAGGSEWKTRLSVFNRSLIDATVEIIFHGGSMQSTMVNLAPGNQYVEDDIVGALGATGSGPIEVRTNTPLIVASRTFNQGDAGTFGQFIDGDLPIEAAKNGQRRWLTMLEETDAYRTNIGFTNTGTEPAAVLVTLYDSAANVLADFEVEIAAGANVQENQVFSNRAGRGDITAGFASVVVQQGSGVIAYGSVIDNATGDPVTIPAKR